MKRITGVYEHTGTLECFIPSPLPPQNPPLALDKDLAFLYGQAHNLLGQLNERFAHLQHQRGFIKACLIKESLLSCALGNMHSTFAQALTPNYMLHTKETQGVLHYSQALSLVITGVREQEKAIFSKLLYKAHTILLRQGQYRLDNISLGNVWAPPATAVPELMIKLKQYINTNTEMLPLIKVGLVHAQFAMIRPFAQGNSRMNRMLLAALLIKEGLLQEPILYPSLYFKKTQRTYVACLEKVRTQGDFEGWLRYFLQGIIYSAQDALRRAKDIEVLKESLVQKNLNASLLGYLFENPVVTIPEVAEKLHITYNSANSIIQKMVAVDILRQTSPQKRNKAFEFTAYLDLLEQDYE